MLSHTLSTVDNANTYSIYCRQCKHILYLPSTMLSHTLSTVDTAITYT
ncbi:hypothetical protein TOT_040000355 [Theileria orientalis strain Shintoku]|uniref:Uncharacterized protein n=1 Tax=Theileria orientalis strain Shintoku TaxID=869250 RepID=J4C4D1_THEOR|nr:hypothetical protein TOT_040000355 [Theileria orientalis strain Shintoku]BAM41976.1 hypothetical protein TOT_040000355 [Theileria orientalis strain Shintoku]|eukprot:XP_009692277.1 hypothetical protein TOT_040000355 [Theileria orientalis strain Shintoku]